MVQIIPAILSTSEEDYRRDIARYKMAQSFQMGWIHIDLMDNKLVPNKSIEPSVTAKYPINLHKEAHPMALHPIEWVDDLIEAGFERIIIHIEAQDVDKCINYIKEKGLEAGLALNNETPVEKLEVFISKITTVLVMSIEPGFQGQPFLSSSLDKIKEIKAKNWPVRVGIDGAVKDSNIKDIISAGVDFVIVGSYFLNGDIDERLEEFWEAING